MEVKGTKGTNLAIVTLYCNSQKKMRENELRVNCKINLKLFFLRIVTFIS